MVTAGIFDQNSIRAAFCDGISYDSDITVPMMDQITSTGRAVKLNMGDYISAGAGIGHADFNVIAGRCCEGIFVYFTLIINGSRHMPAIDKTGCGSSLGHSQQPYDHKNQ